jgi:hypothetical protein
MYRVGIKHGNFPDRILVPPVTQADAFGKVVDPSWDDPTVVKTFAPDAHPIFMAETFARYRKAVLDGVVNTGNTVALVEDPVQHFVRIWGILIKTTETPMAQMAEFMEDPSKFPTISAMLKNPSSARFLSDVCS